MDRNPKGKMRERKVGKEEVHQPHDPRFGCHPSQKRKGENGKNLY
jgi:hypothetical protein